MIAMRDCYCMQFDLFCDFCTDQKLTARHVWSIDGAQKRRWHRHHSDGCALIIPAEPENQHHTDRMTHVRHRPETGMLSLVHRTRTSSTRCCRINRRVFVFTRGVAESANVFISDVLRQPHALHACGGGGGFNMCSLIQCEQSRSA
jgi:hypothetical protein